MSEQLKLMQSYVGDLFETKTHAVTNFVLQLDWN